MRITSSIEKYLRVIYDLSENDKTIRVTDIANAMDVQKPSVNKALNILKEEALINYEKYKGITLTKNGFVMAKHISKTHNLFKGFLINVLEVEDGLAESESDDLAHCVSCHTTAKLERYIENILKEN